MLCLGGLVSSSEVYLELGSRSKVQHYHIFSRAKSNLIGCLRVSCDTPLEPPSITMIHFSQSDLS